MSNSRFFKSLKEFFFGFSGHEHVVTALKTKAGMGDLLTIALFGDMLGLPIFRPYYAMRLLPYVLPRLEGWKRRMLRERDLVDALD
jgi:hypothetical protein